MSASSPVRRLALKASLTVHALFDLGASTGTAILTNSLRAARLDRREAEVERRAAVPRTPGRLVAAEPVPGGARCRFEEGELELVFCAPDLVRVDWEPGRVPLPWALNGPLAAAEGPPSAVTVVTGPDTGCVVRSAALEVEVTRSGEIRYRADGRLVRHELAPLRRGAGRTSRFLLRQDERVAGLGEQAAGVDLRGGVHRLWNRDPGGAYGPGQDPLYLGIPVLVGLHPDGDVLVFYENTFEARVRLDGHRPPTSAPRASGEVRFAGGTLRHYVAVGDLAGVLERYSALTGRPPLPPRWALGYHQCRWGYRSETEVAEVAEGFAREGLPLSALHLDIDYMDHYRVFTVDPERFSDLGRLSAELLERGTRVVTIVDPAVKEESGDRVFDEGVAGGHFVEDPDRPGVPYAGVVWPGRAVYPDFTRPATRRWWGEQYRVLLDQGVAGIWHDMNEPTSIAVWGDRTLPRSAPHDAEGRGGDHRECHNVYGHLMNRAAWEALAELRPDRRPFLLSRSGWAGLARWAWNWTADIESSWEGLRQQVATAVGLGLSGVPYTGSDVGGFSGAPGPELYVRWLELSVLMPFCRTHSVTGAPPREPWRWPEPERSAVGRLIRLRYRLLPYLYALAEEASRTGAPLVRPLEWPGRSADRRLRGVDDAYLLGGALLVAPVTRPGATSRTVTLPAGRWYRFGDGVDVLEGARTVTVAAPLGHPVVLVREGTIVPLDDGWVDGVGPVTVDHRPRQTAFHCFPDARGNAWGEAYDDAGDGDGPVRRDHLELAAADDAGALLTWRSEGEFPRPDEARVVLPGRAVGRAIADGQEVPVEVGPGPVSSLVVPPFERLTIEW